MMGNVSDRRAVSLGGFIPGAVMTIFMMLYVSYLARGATAWGADQAFRWGRAVQDLYRCANRALMDGRSSSSAA